MQNEQAIVVIDAGRSAVKVVLRVIRGQEGITERFLFPSVVMRAADLSDEAEALRARDDAITMDGVTYWAGATAQIQRGPGVGTELSDNWIQTDEHRILLLSAMRRVEERLQRISSANATKIIVLGLPGRHFRQQREVLKNVAAGLFQDCEVKVIPQPKAPFHYYLQREDGRLAEGRNLNESWAVIDVGRFTTDIAVINEGHFIEQGLASSDGTKGAAEAMLAILNNMGIRCTITDAEKALMQRSIRNRGQLIELDRESQIATQTLVDEIMATVTRVIEPYSTSLNGLILAGGGAPLIAQTIRSQWSNVFSPQAEDARFMVAEGMARLAAGILLARRATVVSPAAA